MRNERAVELAQSAASWCAAATENCHRLATRAQYYVTGEDDVKVRSLLSEIQAACLQAHQQAEQAALALVAVGVPT